MNIRPLGLVSYSFIQILVYTRYRCLSRYIAKIEPWSLSSFFNRDVKSIVRGEYPLLRVWILVAPKKMFFVEWTYAGAEPLQIILILSLCLFHLIFFANYFIIKCLLFIHILIAYIPFILSFIASKCLYFLSPLSFYYFLISKKWPITQLMPLMCHMYPINFSTDVFLCQA